MSQSDPAAVRSRIIEAKVRRVFVGAMEPANFVECEGVRLLKEAGIEVLNVEAGAQSVICAHSAAFSDSAAVGALGSRQPG